MKKQKAFTMAEAVLVMTILGIIATIMITTMKPAKFKDKGYDVLAKSIYGSIDTAVTQILVDKAPYNKMSNIYEHNSTTTLFAMNTSSNGGRFIALLKDYMATARGDIPTACNVSITEENGSGANAYDASMLLKNGACISVKSGEVTRATRIPGEISDTTSTSYSYGMLFLDTNGADEPNIVGKDRYYIPFDENGIVSGD